MAVGGKPFTLTLAANASQNRLAQPLPFAVRALQCDNFTSQWLQVVESGVYVPPYYTDRVILVPDGTHSITVVAAAPPGYAQAPPIKGQQAIFTPFGDFAQPSLGIYQPPSSASPQQVQIGLNSIQTTGAAVTATIPTPLAGIGLIFQPSSGGGGGSFSVTSLPSGIGLVATKVSDNGAIVGQGRLEFWIITPSAYAEQTGQAGSPPTLLGLADTQLRLSVTSGGGGNPTAVLQYFALGASQQVWNMSDRPLYVQGVAGSPLPENLVQVGGAAIALGQAPAASSLPAILASDQGLGSGIVPGAKVANADGALGAGASTTLVSAVGGAQVFCLGIKVEISTAGAAVVNLEDDVGIVLATINTTITGKYFEPLFGAANTQGHLVRIRNTAGVASGALDVNLIYLQSATVFK